MTVCSRATTEVATMSLFMASHRLLLPYEQTWGEPAAVKELEDKKRTLQECVLSEDWDKVLQFVHGVPESVPWFWMALKFLHTGAPEQCRDFLVYAAAGILTSDGGLFGGEQDRIESSKEILNAVANLPPDLLLDNIPEGVRRHLAVYAVAAARQGAKQAAGTQEDEGG